MTKLPTGDGATVSRRHKGSGQLVQTRVARQVVARAPPARTVSAGQGIAEREGRSGSWRPTLVRARLMFSQVAVQGNGLGGRGGTVPGGTTSAVNRLAASEELPEVRQHRNAL
jgi:hypothetical protein